MQEIFKVIEDFPDYEISNLGRVKSKGRDINFNHSLSGKSCIRTKSEKIMKTRIHKYTGYEYLRIKNKERHKTVTIHRLVAESFVENLQDFNTVNHKNGIKTDNRSENLEWCTPEYNRQHAIDNNLILKGEDVDNSILSYKCVVAIKNMLDTGFTPKHIALIFEVSPGVIQHIRTNFTWKHVKNNILLNLKNKNYDGQV